MVTSVTRGTVKLRKNEMDYFCFGSGKTPFVLLPGLSVKPVINSAEGVASAYRMFADDFTVYCFERTKFLDENYTVEMLADDTAEAMESLGLSGVCLMGASQGGMMAQYIAAKHPSLVKKLLLASTCARLFPKADEVMTRWVNNAKSGDYDAFFDYFIDVLFGKAFAEKFGEFIRIAHSDVTKADFERFMLLGRSCDVLDTRGLLGQIKCPSLVIGAVNDRVLTAEASLEIAQLLGCPCYFYGAEYGHCVFDEAPDYKQRIYDFFTA